MLSHKMEEDKITLVRPFDVLRIVSEQFCVILKILRIGLRIAQRLETVVVNTGVLRECQRHGAIGVSLIVPHKDIIPCLFHQRRKEGILFPVFAIVSTVATEKVFQRRTGKVGGGVHPIEHKPPSTISLRLLIGTGIQRIAIEVGMPFDERFANNHNDIQRIVI